jgi:hypothetical protein
MSKFTTEQREICCRYGSDIVVCDPAMKVGIALATIDRSPPNALRHPVLGDATGWFIWGGELSTDDDFFQPMQASHLFGVVPRLIPYYSQPNAPPAIIIATFGTRQLMPGTNETYL